MQALRLNFLNLLKCKYHVYGMNLHNIFEFLDIYQYISFHGVYKYLTKHQMYMLLVMWAGLCLLGINWQFVVYQLFYCIQGDHIFHLELFQHYKALLPFCYATNLYLILFLLAKKEEQYLCCVLVKVKS